MSNAMITVADEVLFSRARSGDRAAVVNFANRWWPVIGRFVWGMLGNASQSAAVTEEVVGTVLQSPESAEIPVGRLMYRLALRLMNGWRRSSTRAAEKPSGILEALNRLDWMERAAFLLRDVEQLSLSETTAVLEAPAAQVRAHVHRARVVLTHLLRDLADAVDRGSANPLGRAPEVASKGGLFLPPLARWSGNGQLSGTQLAELHKEFERQQRHDPADPGERGGPLLG